MKNSCNSGLEKLSAREKRVLGGVAEAKTNKEIACELHISPATVKRHLENILRKLQLRNRVEAAVYAVRAKERLPNVGEGSQSESPVYGPFDL